MTVPSPQSSPGGWAPDLVTAGPEWSAATPDQRAAALTVGVHTVWALSGRRYGVAAVLLAPWVPLVPGLGYAGTPQLAGLGGYSPLSHRPAPYGAIDRARRLQLPGPVVEVREVRVQGRVLTPGGDWVLEPVSGRLVRTTGTWPTQDMAVPTFTVSYVRGTVVPHAANLAAGAYAYEWLKGHTGAPGCRLPARTREVARAGVSASMASPEALTNTGLTGVPEVDAFISAANPARMLANGRGFTRNHEPSAIWSPELASHRILEVGPA